MSNEAYIDPRGPERTIVAVDKRSDGAYITLSCGHVRCWNQIFSYHVGEKGRCFTCKEEGNNK
jgi:hypothetical protein